MFIGKDDFIKVLTLALTATATTTATTTATIGREGLLFDKQICDRLKTTRDYIVMRL